LTGVICDICGNVVLSGTLKVVSVKFGERIERVNVCERCWRRDREAPEKYIRKHFEVSRGVKVLHDKIVKHPGVPPRISGGSSRFAGASQRSEPSYSSLRNGLSKKTPWILLASESRSSPNWSTPSMWRNL